MKTKLLCILLVILALPNSNILNGQAVVTLKGHEEYTLDKSKHLLILKDSSRNIENIISRKMFSFSEEYISDKSAVYWSSFKLYNASHQEEIWHINVGLNDYSDLFIVRENEQITSKRTGYLYKSIERDLSPGVNWIPVGIASEESITVYLRTHNPLHLSTNFDYLIQSSKYWQIESRNEEAIDWLFQGILWILIIFCIIFYVSTKQVAAMYYAYYMGSISIVFLYLNGLLRDYFLGEWPWIIPYAMSTIPLAAGTSFLFVSKFLTALKLLPNWNTWIKWLCRFDFLMIPIIGILYYFTHDIPFVTNVNLVVIMVNAIFLAPLCIRLYITKDEISKFYLVGTFFFILCVILTVLSWNTGTSEAPFTKIGFILKTIFYSIGLGISVRLAQKEKEETDAKLIDQLQVNEKLIREQANKLELQVKERTKELMQSNEELRAYDKMISHDLKSPLANINMLVSMLQYQVTEGNKDDIIRLSTMLQQTSDKASKLIHDVLSYATADKKDEQMEEIELNLVVREFLHVSQLTFAEAEVTVSELPKVGNASKVKVYQLFQNLLENALKYAKTDKKPMIKVYFNNKNEVVVEDNGVGFPQDEAENIFKPHKRLDNHKASGIGLGLATCKRITDLHGWKIRAESKSDENTRFFVDISSSLILS